MQGGTNRARCEAQSARNSFCFTVWEEPAEVFFLAHGRAELCDVAYYCLVLHLGLSANAKLVR